MDTQRKAPASVAAESEGQVHSQARCDCHTPLLPSTARLIAKRTPPRPGRRDATLYHVEFDGELVVEDSREPGLDLARVLKARGIGGVVVLRDGQTGAARISIDIGKAALLTVREDQQCGPIFTRWKPLEGDEGPHRSGETVAEGAP